MLPDRSLAIRSVGIAARAQSTSNFHSLVLSNIGRVELRRVSGGGVTSLAYASTEPSTFYGYALDSTASLPTTVPAGAGVGKI